MLPSRTPAPALIDRRRRVVHWAAGTANTPTTGWLFVTALALAAMAAVTQSTSNALTFRVGIVNVGCWRLGKLVEC